MNRTQKSIAPLLAAALCGTSLVIQSQPLAHAADPCGSTNGMTLGSGSDTYLNATVAQTGIKTQGMAELIKWRKDALNSSELLWQGKTMRQALAARGMSEAQYLNPQWDYHLERIAAQRAVEATVKADHQRPDGSQWSEVASGGQYSDAEVLAWSSWTRTIASSINDWASEKANLLANNGLETGHYLFLIDPGIVAYGFGTTPTSAAGEGSFTPTDSTTTTEWSGTCSFRVALDPTLPRTVKLSPISAVVGQTRTAAVTVTQSDAEWWLGPQTKTFSAKGTVSAANPAIVSASGLQLTAAQVGTTALTLQSGGTSLALGNFSVVPRSITAVSNPRISTASGTAPVLPSTVTATWNDGATSQQAVTWASVPTTWKNRAGGTFTVSGTVAGTTRTSTATVTVAPAFVTRSTQAKVSTPAGIAPRLPSTVQVVWSNGDVSAAAVTWDAVSAASYHLPGSFTVAGTVAGKRIASAAVTVTAALVRSVEEPTFSVLATRPPTLPSTVQVTWSNGTTTQQAVTWATLSPTSFDHAGTVWAGGIVSLPDGSTTTSKATISVRPIGFSPASGMLPLATNRIGESTGDAYADIWALTSAGRLDFHKYTPGQVTSVGLRGEGLEHISYMGAATDQNGDKRADLFYRDNRDQSLWFAYNQGNGYLTQGVKVGSKWGQMDQIWYAGNMVAGSSKQYILARNKTDGSLWRYTISPTGLYGGIKVGSKWQSLRVMLSPGNMYGDAAWDVVGIHTNGNLYGYKTVNGKLVEMGVVGQRWGSITKAFSPGDGRLDMIAQHSSGDLYAYGNTTTRWTDIGKIGTGFGNYTIMS